MDPQESVRFEEGDDSEFKAVLETVAHSRESLDHTDNNESHQPEEATGSGEFHGGCGSASLRECLEKIAPEEPTISAALHSGEGMGGCSSQMTNPPKKT